MIRAVFSEFFLSKRRLKKTFEWLLFDIIAVDNVTMCPMKSKFSFSLNYIFKYIASHINRVNETIDVGGEISETFHVYM